MCAKKESTISLGHSFIYLYDQVEKHTKPTTQLQQSDALIITICALYVLYVCT